MASVNMASIMAKARACTQKTAFQKKVEEKVDAAMLSGGTLGGKTVHSVTEAAEAFIDVMKSEVAGANASGLIGEYGMSALNDLEHDSPGKSGKNTYQIGVSFTTDHHRSSLAPDRYDGVDNIIALLNRGYSAGGTVYGKWHGKQIASKMSRPGAHFVENGVSNFMGSRARECGVKSIEINGGL